MSNVAKQDRVPIPLQTVFSPWSGLWQDRDEHAIQAPCLKRAIVFAFSFLTTLSIGAPSKDVAYPSLYQNAAFFEEAIRNEADVVVPSSTVTGITVPHHLLAPDLIARGFHAASLGHYHRLIILFPDHFKQVKKPFATTLRNFNTPFGTLTTDVDAVTSLLASTNLIDESDLFEKDHGIQAVLPFAGFHFPNAKVVPVCLGISSQPNQWRELVDALAPLVDEKTLVIQSTDFSHYLPPGEAARRDRETLNLLAVDDIAAIEKLLQPDHLDSKAAQWVQMTLQREIYSAAPVVIANENSQGHVPWPIRRTTSYIVQIYDSPPKNLEQPSRWPVYKEQSLCYFGGDVFLGRYMTACLTDPVRAKSLQKAILDVTGGNPLIINLEGVPVPGEVQGLSGRQLTMPEDLTIEWLRALNVVAVSVANNHWNDMGEEGAGRSRKALESHGIKVIGHGESTAVGEIEVTAFTDLSNTGSVRRGLISAEAVKEAVSSGTTGPRVAFVHWGEEFEAAAGIRENEISDWLRRFGYDAAIGCHPHCVGDPAMEALAGGGMMRVYSLGNLLFDQNRPEAGGGLVEMRVFAQGTCFFRWIDIGNLYRDANRLSKQQ